MFDNKKARGGESDWERISLPIIEPLMRKEAYDNIPDSVWRDHAHQVLVAIAVAPDRVIASSSDHVEIKTLADAEGVSYFIAPSKFYLKPEVGSDKSVA